MAIGVPRPLAIEKPQAVDLVQAARYFGAHGEPDAATLALLQKCAVPLLAAAMPRAVWLLADTPALTEAGLLPGEDVHKHLAGCGQAILLAVTLGPGVDAQIRRAGVQVYYETDQFVCYKIEQNMYHLYNFAIDYGYNQVLDMEK